MRGFLAAVVIALTPLPAWASSCPVPAATRTQLETPAGVAEYRAAATVSVVKFEKVATPPCAWVKLIRLFNRGAYPRDTCEPTARSQRYRLKLVEALKGSPSPTADAIFAEGRDAINYEWLAEHRPEVVWNRPSTMGSGDPRDRGAGGRIRSHSDFGFRHRGQIENRGVVVKAYACGDDTVPFIVPYGGRLPYLIFQNAQGRITGWEPAGDSRTDMMIERLRRLKAGQTDVRETVQVRDFFARLPIASLYETKWCGDYSRIRPLGGQRNGRLDRLVRGEHIRSDEPCRPGQRYLVVGGGWPEDDRGPQRFYGEERSWPSVQLVPVDDRGAIRIADIVTQFRLEGPETIPVSQALAWTD